MYDKLCRRKTDVLRNSSMKAHVYATCGYEKIDGEFLITLKANDRDTQAKFHAIGNTTDSLLYRVFQLLGLVAVNNNRSTTSTIYF